MQTFEEYWKEYCAKKRLVEKGPMMQGIKHIVQDAWKAAFYAGYDDGYEQAVLKERG